MTSTAFTDYVDREIMRRVLHRVWTEKPYEDCECSEGGRCQPKDPAKRNVIRGLEAL